MTPDPDEAASPMDPSGVVRGPAGRRARTFLFSDLRGYTAFVETRGDDAAALLLSRYRDLVRRAVAAFGGAEVKTEGDSFYIVFESASDAVRCGLTIIREASRGGPDGKPVDVGVGIHAGEAAEADGGYVGSAVNIAARVCAVAAPGQVLVTDTVRGLTRTTTDLGFTPAGRRRLKGVSEPIAVFAAHLASRPGVAPPAPTPGRRDARLVGALAIAGIGIIAVAGGIALMASGGAVPSATPTSSFAGRTASALAGSGASATVGTSPAGASTVATTWIVETGDPIFVGARVGGVSTASEGFLIVGSTNGATKPGVWESRSGAPGTWHRVDATVFGTARLADAANSGTSSLIVVAGSSCSSADDCQPVSWTTQDPDFRTGWVAGTFVRTGAEPRILAGIGVGGPGFLAVAMPGGSEVQPPIASASTDGSRWGPPAAIGDAAGVAVSDVAGGIGGDLAIGGSGLDGAVWTSADDRTWTRVDTGTDLTGARPASIAATRTGYIAVGGDGGGPAAWSSEDGRHWRVVSDLPHLSLVTRLTGVAVASDGSAMICGDSPDGPVLLYAAVLGTP